MKRTLSDLFEGLNISEKETKKMQIQPKYEMHHNDIFNMGKIELSKDYYTKDEVINIINKHEMSLMTKFKVFLTSFIPKTSNSIIPLWVK